MKQPLSLSMLNQLDGVHGSGKLLVNPESPSDIHQGTLDEANNDDNES